MSDKDAPLSRVRRAKSRESVPSRVDGGAIAVGLVVALGAHLVPALLVLVGVFDTLLNAITLATLLAFPLGSYVAGRYAGGSSTRGGVHGVIAVAASLAFLAGSTVLFVGTDRALAEFGRLLVASGEPPLVAGTAVCLLLSGGVGGALGANRT